MKKIVILGLVIIILFSVIAFAEVKCIGKAEGNPIVNELEKIKEVLLNILEKLGIIAEKETTITVEPNITVVPPEVNVYPDVNVTLPEEECKWEKYYFSFEFDNFPQNSPKILYIPSEVKLSEFRATDVEAVVYHSNWFDIYVNDILCLAHPMDNIDHPNTIRADLCTEAFVAGKNKILVVPKGSGGDYAKLLSLDFESEIKPANC